MKKTLIIISSVILLGVIASIGYVKYPELLKNNQMKPIATYFQYSAEELQGLKALTTQTKLTVADLKELDRKMFDLVERQQIGDGYAARIYTYTYIAQREAAILAHNASGEFLGDLSAVTQQTFCLFYADECKINMTTSDPYADHLAKLVVNKLKQRMDADQKKSQPYEQLQGEQYWAGTKPYFGQDFGSWQPWTIKSASQFRAPAPAEPATPFWLDQLANTKAALNNATAEQKSSVVEWAGGPGTITPPGKWLQIGNAHMWEIGIGLEQALKVRAALAMSTMDAVIAVFDSKYTYWRKRPFMLDPTIVTIMPTPNHPSHPAGHSTISAAAATVLSHFFPDQKAKWSNLSDVAGNSRIWGGIHFPIDHTAGMTIGSEVGKAVYEHVYFN